MAPASPLTGHFVRTHGAIPCRYFRLVPTCSWRPSTHGAHTSATVITPGHRSRPPRTYDSGCGVRQAQIRSVVAASLTLPPSSGNATTRRNAGADRAVRRASVLLAQIRPSVCSLPAPVGLAGQVARRLSDCRYRLPDRSRSRPSGTSRPRFLNFWLPPAPPARLGRGSPVPISRRR